MRKYGFVAALAIGVAAVFAPQAEARDLTVVSWGGAYQDAQRDVYFRPFMQQSNARMLEESWDGGIGVLRAKIQSGNNNWDVVQVEGDELLIGCDEGLFEQLDYARIGGRDRYLPQATHECGVGSILYNFVLAWDRSRYSGTPTWQDFFAPDRVPGARGLRRNVKGALEYALLGDGVPPADVYRVLATPEGVDRAFRALDRIKPNVVWWSAMAQAPQILGSGEVMFTQAANGRITSANRNEGRNFGIQWAGSLAVVDSWVIMRNSPNRDQAYQFLNFVSAPQLQAQLTQRIPYGGPSRGANDDLSPEVRAVSPTNPENLDVSLRLNDQFWLDNLDRLNQRFNAWLAR